MERNGRKIFLKPLRILLLLILDFFDHFSCVFFCFLSAGSDVGWRGVRCVNGPNVTVGWTWCRSHIWSPSSLTGTQLSRADALLKINRKIPITRKHLN